MGGEVRVGGWEVAGDRSCTQRAGEGSTADFGSRERGEAHPEHVAHFCDAGRVEAQWLVEHRRGLPRVKSRACDAGRGAVAGRREVAGDGSASSAHRRAGLQIGSRSRGGAHPEHEAHVCDAGGVEAQRLVERQRALPSPKGAPDKGRHAWHRDGTEREGRISRARGVRVWPSSGVWAEGAGGSAHKT